MNEPIEVDRLPIPDEFISLTRYAYHKNPSTPGGATVNYTYKESTGELLRNGEVSRLHVMATEMFMIGSGCDDAPNHMFLEYI